MNPGTVVSILKVVAELGVVVAKAAVAKPASPQRVDELWAEAKARLAMDRADAEARKKFGP